MNKKMKHGHLFAFIAIFIWSTTYVATKTLLLKYTPTDILLVRFLFAFLFLFILFPRLSPPKSYKEEFFFFVWGLRVSRCTSGLKICPLPTPMHQM